MLGAGSAEALGGAEALVGTDGLGAGSLLGAAVGVGTGGVTQWQTGLRRGAGLIALSGDIPAFVGLIGATAVAGAARWWVAVGRGRPVTVPSRADGDGDGDGAGTATGCSPAAARPRVTSRYDPVAPTSPSAHNATTTTNRRRGRASVSGGTVRHSISDPGNVLRPVEVTSGPSVPSAGRRHRSYLTERQAPASSPRILRHRLINCSPIWSGTLYA